MADSPAHTPAERLLSDSLIDEAGLHRPLSQRTLNRQRSVEAYLRGEMLPRYIVRAKQIEQARRRHEEALAAEYRALRTECGGDGAAFAWAWTERARRWDFADVNDLVDEHNEWYPVERNLAMDPRTRDYVRIGGRSYRKEPLGPAWVLRRFPAWLRP
ncbi:MAG TPA: hypothetical protein VHX88_22355 [Solirubrobacteraceae bacterium]|jgi:hypothetical protein|nr:hypothetical protein [Solirubrobacteraceae bacterium]